MKCRTGAGKGRWRQWVLGSLAAALGLECPRAAGAQGSESAADIPCLGYELVRSWPHDRTAFTEGLTWSQGTLVESTGLYGHSALRRRDLATGRILRWVALPDEYFGEGIAVLNGRIFQLSWKNETGFVYDELTLRQVATFSFRGEGWGLTSDGRDLIMSDGSNRLRFIDPRTFATVRSIDVLAHGQPVSNLNELEFVKGEIYANVWQTQFILRIDPATGRINSEINLVGLLPADQRGGVDDVMNGIAYDPAQDRLFVTGKNWPALFEIRPKNP
jgi:glutaminyl-peptide cyclotransferase